MSANLAHLQTSIPIDDQKSNMAHLLDIYKILIAYVNTNENHFYFCSYDLTIRTQMKWNFPA